MATRMVLDKKVKEEKAGSPLTWRKTIDKDTMLLDIYVKPIRDRLEWRRLTRRADPK